MFKTVYRILSVLLVLSAICGMAYKGRIKEDFENYKMRAIPALMYHSISEVPAGWPADLCVAPGVFEEHLQYLKAQGYNVVTAPQAVILLKSRQNVMNTVIMTFDDGYENNYTEAFPLLKKYGFRGNFYIVGNDAGKEKNQDGMKKYMSFAQIKEMHDQGMEIGSHSMSHDPLTSIKPELLPWEIYQPLNLFYQKMNFWISGIAFPNGAFNDAIIAEIRKYFKYEYGFSGQAGCNTLKIVEETPFALRRTGVYDRGNGAKDVEKALQKCYVFGYLEEKGFPVSLLDKARRLLPFI
jgi:peptidoglycan/xylan/chitin deacetylase (PgdA/CDA1 family)